MRVSEMDGRRVAWIDITHLEDVEAAQTPLGDPETDNDRARRQDMEVRRRLAEASQAADEATPGI